MPELTFLAAFMQTLRERWRQLRAQPEAGYSTEAVVITALLVAAALAAVAIITAKVLAKAKSINLN